MSKMYFIIWGYLNGLIRVENTDTLLKIILIYARTP
jgi:hypothetical protein